MVLAVDLSLEWVVLAVDLSLECVVLAIGAWITSAEWVERTGRRWRIRGRRGRGGWCVVR